MTDRITQNITEITNHPEFLTIKNKIENLDLAPIKFKMIKEKGWSPETAERVEPLYKAYLMLYAVLPDETHVPSVEIDEMWHAHILDTEKYMADCYNIFGYYLHHFPYLGLRGEEDAQRLDDSFNQTRELFQALMGCDPLDGVEATGCGGGGCGGGSSCSSSSCSSSPSSCSSDPGPSKSSCTAIIPPSSCSSTDRRKKDDKPSEDTPTPQQKAPWWRRLGLSQWEDSVNPLTMNMGNRPGKKELAALAKEYEMLSKAPDGSSIN